MNGAEWIIGLVLAPHYSSMSIGDVPRASGADGRRPRRRVQRHRELGDRAGVRRLPRPPTSAPRLAAMPAATACRVHRALAARAHPRRGRPVSGRRSRRRRRPWPPTAGLADDRWSVGWQSAGRTPEPWIGPDILTVDRRAGRRRPRRACSCARAGSSPTTSRCSTTSTSRRLGEPTRPGIAFDRRGR